MKAPPDLFRWARWQFDNGAPTHFTPEQAEENCRYLIDVLGERWLIKGMMHPGGDNHPLLRRWAHAGGVDYLALNALASDLRVLEGVPGLGDVLHDVRNIDRSEPAQHTLRSAAQFARVPGGRIEQLFPSDVGGPDYTASTEAGRIAVEAKFMTLSDGRPGTCHTPKRCLRRCRRACLTGRDWPADWFVPHTVLRAGW